MVHEILLVLFVIASVVAVVEIRRSTRPHRSPPDVVDPTERVASAPGRTAIVVEPSRLARSSISRLLEREGYQVIEAADGNEAQRRLAEGSSRLIDLVAVVDVGPATDGARQFVDVLLAMSSEIPTRIVVMAVDDPGPAMGAGEASGIDCLRKPFEGETL